MNADTFSCDQGAFERTALRSRSRSVAPLRIGQMVSSHGPSSHRLPITSDRKVWSHHDASSDDHPPGPASAKIAISVAINPNKNHTTAPVMPMCSANQVNAWRCRSTGCN